MLVRDAPLPNGMLVSAACSCTKTRSNTIDAVHKTSVRGWPLLHVLRQAATCQARVIGRFFVRGLRGLLQVL